MSSNPELMEIHEELLILLKEFHRICKENNIKYSLHGGTLLGAIREKGFIPWDDDVDVTLIRPEYEKLCAIFKEEKNRKNIILNVFDKMKCVVMKRKNKPIVWIDVLVYDYIPQNIFGQRCKIYAEMFLSGFIKRKDTFALTKAKQYGGWRYGAFYLAYLLGKPVPYSLKFKMFDIFCKNCFCGDKKFIHRSNDQYIGAIVILPAEVMSDYIIVPFENTELMVSESYHEILVSSYGYDYMIPKKYVNQHNTVRKFLNESIGKSKNTGER